MPRQQSPFYQSPGASIGASLGQALFGDPEMALKQRQIDAEIAARQAAARESDAHAGYYTTQATGQTDQNAASRGLPALFAGLTPHAATQLPDNVDDFIAAPDAHYQPQETPEAAMRRGLPALMTALTQMQGDKLDPTKTIGTLASFLGGDELARRGLVAQGHSPDKDFAITPERADTIAANLADASQRKGVAEAIANHANDIPVARVNHANDVPVALANHSNDIPVANIAAGSREEVAAIRANNAPGFDVITNAFPGAHENSGLRSVQHNAAVGGATHSDHLGQRPGVQGYDIPPQPGFNLRTAAARIEAMNPGVKVIDARPADPGEGAHWHFSLQNTSKAGKPAAVKPVNNAAMQLLENTFAQKFGPDGIGKIPPDVMTSLRNRAVTIYQKTGNPVQAVQQAYEERKAQVQAAHAAPAAAQSATAPKPKAISSVRPAGVPDDARQRSDGKWFYQRGKQWFQAEVQ